MALLHRPVGSSRDWLRQARLAGVMLARQI